MASKLRQRGEGKWEFSVNMGKGPDGKYIRKWYTVEAKTAKEAQVAQRKILTEMDNGTFVEPSKLTVAEFLVQWIDGRSKLANKTVDRYRQIINLHLIPALGAHRLQKLHQMHIQAYYAEARKRGKKNGDGGGLSERTLLHHHRCLSTALKAAVRMQLLFRNPCELVESPKPEREEMVILEEDQVGTLLGIVKGTSLYLPVLLAVTTGLRRGEICGLRWKDIDFTKKTLSVRQAVEDTKSGIALKAPKTKASRRTIPMPDMLVEELRRFHTDHKAKVRFKQGAYKDLDLVCAKEDGGIMDPGWRITYPFGWLWTGRREKSSKPAADARLPKCRFHDLRHTHASMLIKQGVHMKVISERLGHGSIGITMDTYGHLLPGVQESAMVAFDQTLRMVTQKKA